MCDSKLFQHSQQHVLTLLFMAYSNSASDFSTDKNSWRKVSTEKYDKHNIKTAANSLTLSFLKLYSLLPSENVECQN